jgi:hypothetical protein
VTTTNPVPPAPTVPGPNPPVVPTPVPASPPVVRPFDESLLRGREFLLEVASPQPIAVRDPELGLVGSDRSVALAAEAFFHAAAEGKLDETRLVPRWTSYLSAWAQRFHTAGGAGKVRVGEGIPEGDLLLVPVKLTAEGKQSWQGWVALARDGKDWLISDVQVTDSVASTGPFDPESSSQEISRPNLR